VSELIRHFNHKHHSKALKRISEPIDELAHMIDELLANGKNKSDGLRALKKARESFIKALVDSGEAGAAKPGSIGRARSRRKAAGASPPHL
jgi:hypothetical protein